MSRRRSQSQKENRERAVNTRRQLEALQELEMSTLDTSVAMTNMSVVQEKILNNSKLIKNEATKERLKQLQRWKERKALEKEKEKRQKERKGVFKTGLYHPKDTLTVGSLPPVPAAPGKVKETKANTSSVQSTRVTRSMKQQQVQKPLKTQDVNTTAKKAQPVVERTTRNRVAAPKPAPPSCKTNVEPVSRGLSTRSANKTSVTAVPVVKDKPKAKSADVRTTRSKVSPPPVTEENSEVHSTVLATVLEETVSEPEIQKPEEKPCPPSPAPHPEEEEMVVEQTVADPAPSEDVPKSDASSFAPNGFLFQAPVGLSSFKFDPLTPRSADAFLTPSSSFTLPPAPAFEEESEKPSPPKSPRRSPPAPPKMADTPTEAPAEVKHDVPYFRSEIANETDRLTGLCGQWECKVEDESIPEEMRDRMRTAVGQARLLMKERFHQFGGLVDDCEFGRGEKITTCTDLQGFWDMVYYQVEDVLKKFDALKEAETRGWVEEHKPPPRQKKVVKKPVAAAAPAKPAGTKAAARSRLAAAKAAMKARQQAAETEKTETEQSSQEVPPEPQNTDTVVFNGGFFQVQSPAKTPGSVRRSSRLSAAVAQSPSNYLTPRRSTRRSLALTKTPVQPISNPPPSTTPSHLCPVVQKTSAKASEATPQPSNSPLTFSPVKEVSTNYTEQTNLIPSISVVEEQEECDEVSDVNKCPQISPCKSPESSQASVPSESLSFPLSPTVSCTPRPVQNLLNAQDSTPNSSVNEDNPGVDFERYLQPSQRDSLSPRQPFVMESPVTMDVESPRGESEHPVTQTVSTTLPTVPALFPSQSPQTVESALLLFTPDVKDRIRQSVCPSDLMVFTPPQL